MNSSLGTGDSNATNPFPERLKLNNPSFPSTAEDKLLRITTFCRILDSQAKNNPVI